MSECIRWTYIKILEVNNSSFIVDSEKLQLTSIGMDESHAFIGRTLLNFQFVCAPHKSTEFSRSGCISVHIVLIENTNGFPQKVNCLHQRGIYDDTCTNLINEYVSKAVISSYARNWDLP